MEADVALHTPEKWAQGGDPRSDKIKYVYSNRRKEREAKSARKASRLQQIKPSRSYDNDIESSVTKEATGTQPPPAPRTKDDSSMRYGERSSRQTGRSSGIPTPTSSPYTSRKNPHASVHGGGGNAVASEPRWQSKDRRAYSSRERRKNSGGGGGDLQSPRVVDRGIVSPDGLSGQQNPAHKRSQKSSRSGLPLRSGIPTPQGIVLEVKDGPSIRYKPSDTMLCDVSEPERYGDIDSCNNNALSPSSPPLSSSDQANNNNSVSDGFNPSTDFSEENVSVASSPFDQPGPTNVICKQPTRSGIDPDDRPLPTLQQKAATSNPASFPGSESLVFHNVAEVSQRRYGVKHDDIVVGPAAFRQRFHSAGSPPHSSEFNLSPIASDEAAFSSMSLMTQQQAGVRHDDIVVGPNAKKQKAKVRNANEQPDDMDLPQLSIHHSLDSPVDNNAVGSVGFPRSDSDIGNIQFAQQSPDSGNYSGPPSMNSQKDSSYPCASTLERESRIPKGSVERDRAVNVELKQRAGSPFTGIPVFRREKSVDRYQDNVNIRMAITNQPASVVEDKSRNQILKSPVCMDDDGNRTDRSYGSVDRAKWRPKPGKSGLHRMKRGAKKREANVSTESGYATDQMPSSGEANDSKISPKRGHRIGGSCNDIDKDLEELVLESRRQLMHTNEDNVKTGTVIHSPSLPRRDQRITGSKSRSMSTNNTPMRKQGSTERGSPSSPGAKIGMLSTIPVPMGRDEPYRKPNNPNLSQRQHDRRHTPDSYNQTSSSPSPSSSSLSPSSQEGPRQIATSSPKHNFPMDANTTTTNHPQQIEPPSLSSSSISSTCKSSSRTQTPQTPQSSASSPEKKTSPSISSSTTTPHEPTTTQQPHISSSGAPIKPRLHRSAEHLVGTTKLSVFHSTEDVKHNNHQYQQHPDNASDISCSTTSSTKTSKSVPLDYMSPTKKTKSSSRKRMEALATPKRSTTTVAAKGRSVSLLRRESDRSVAIVRRGSDRAITVSRHDPSVQDLKAATSHKELCQSMASLLNIDNEKAAEMLSTSLSKRRDLVEGLDADAILDYLTHHGVLDPNILVTLEAQCQGQGEPAVTIHRNSAILKHVEEHGDTAVALFINALRQSGQLHLASSLDTEQRIKPVSEGVGYLDKPRHKGEIVVRLTVEALKILAPREPPNERNVNLSLLHSPSQENGPDFVDSEDEQVKSSCWCFCMSRKRRSRSSSSKKDKRKHIRNYEDQYRDYDLVSNEGATTLSSTNPNSSKYTATTTTTAAIPMQDAVDFNYPSSNNNRHNRAIISQNDADNGSNGSKIVLSSISSQPLPSSSPLSSSANIQPSSHSKSGKEKEKKKKNSKLKNPGKQQQPHVPGDSGNNRMVSTIPEADFRCTNPLPPQQQHPDNPPPSSSSSMQNSKKKSKNNKSSKQQQGKGNKKKNPPDPKQIPRNLNLQSSTSPPMRPKDGEGIFMEYDPQLELVKLRACHDELASPTRQAGPVGIMVEQWKSSGKHFLVKSDMLCRSIVEDFLTDIIKYFEQDRGTLVLDVVSEATSVTVFNICMTKNQVTKLEKDHFDGSLLDKLQEVFMSRLDISQFDIRGVSFCTEVDGNQIKSVLSEL